MKRALWIGGLLIGAVSLMVAVALMRPPVDPEGFRAPTRTPLDFSADVRIVYPPDGAILYAEALTVRGTSSAPQRFRVELVTDSVRSSRLVEAQAGEWSVEWVHGYRGEPTEATIRAVPLESEGEYSRVLVVLSHIRERPEGAEGTLTFPRNGSEIGGDVVLLEGRASGLAENRLDITFKADDGTIIDEQSVILDNPYFVDDLPFRVELATNGYVGSATITVQFGDDHAETVAVLVSSAAG